MEKKIRILFTTRQFYPCVGGTETYVLECAKRLVERGHTVKVLTLNYNLWSGERMPSRGEVAGIEIHRVSAIPFQLKPIPNPFRFVTWKLHRWADLVHTHDIRLFFEIQWVNQLLNRVKAFFTGVRRPWMIGSYGYIFHQKKIEGLKKAVFQRYFKPFFHLAESIHCISYQDFEKLKDPVLEAKSFVLPGGVDTRAWATSERAPERGRLLYFGRLDRHKGLDLLFDALAKLKDVAYEVRVVFGSETEGLRAELSERASALGIADRVRWIGKLSMADLKTELSKCHSVVLPSRYEGFGLTTVEAMAASVAPIVNDIDAFRNVLTPDKDGFILPFENAEATAIRLRDILEMSLEKLTEMEKAARATALTYDWDQRVDELERQYEKIYGSK